MHDVQERRRKHRKLYRCSFAQKCLILSLECPRLLVRNETVNNELYLYPHQVETELTATSKGTLTVNCTSSGWPTPRIDWDADIPARDIVTTSYNLPNYNVTANGQVRSFINCWQCHVVQLIQLFEKYVCLYILCNRFLLSCFQAWKR